MKPLRCGKDHEPIWSLSVSPRPQHTHASEPFPFSVSKMQITERRRTIPALKKRGLFIIFGMFLRALVLSGLLRFAYRLYFKFYVCLFEKEEWDLRWTVYLRSCRGKSFQGVMKN